MNQKPANKFIGSYIHLFLFIAVLVVPPFECNHTVFKLDDPVIRNGNTMRIPSEIFYYTASVFKGRLTVD